MSDLDDEAYEDLPLLNEQLCFALYTATHRIIRAYRPLLEPHGITYVQYLVMLVLWERAPCAVGEIGQQLHLDSGTLTPMLKRMEKSGLVARTRDRSDERRVLITLTDQGQSLRVEARQICDSMLCRLQYSEQKARDLRNEILALADALH